MFFGPGIIVGARVYDFILWSGWCFFVTRRCGKGRAGRHGEFLGGIDWIFTRRHSFARWSFIICYCTSPLRVWLHGIFYDIVIMTPRSVDEQQHRSDGLDGDTRGCGWLCSPPPVGGLQASHGVFTTDIHTNIQLNSPITQIHHHSSIQSTSHPPLCRPSVMP